MLNQKLLIAIFIMFLSNIIAVGQSTNVGVGTTTPTEKLEVTGNVLSNGLSDSYFIADRNSNENKNGLLLQTNGVSFWSLGMRDVLNEGFNIWDEDASASRIFINDISGNVGISTLSPKSKFEVGGSFGIQVTSINTSTYTAGNEAIILADAGTGTITISLPAAATVSNRIYTIKKTDATNNVIIDPNGAELIEGSSTATLANQFDFYKIVSDGTAWYVIGTNVTAESEGGGGFENLLVFTSSGTWVVPSEVTQIMVEVWGAGGGGASGSTTGPTRGCGGMGGGYGKSYLTVVPAASHAVTIGEGGPGAPSGPCSTGSTGGTSSFGTPLAIQSTGGQGGNGCGSNLTRQGGTSTGQISMTGGKGPDGQTNNRNYGGLAGDGSTYGQGGTGDTSFFGRDGSDGKVVIHW